MSLRSKLWCSFGGLLLILIAVSVLSVAVLTRYSRALENVFRENYQSAVYCNGMKEALDRLNARAEHLVWRENDAAALIDADAERRQFETDLSRQLGNISLPGETQLSERLAQLWKEYKAHYADFDAAHDSRQDLYRNDLLPRHQELKEVAQKVADMNMSNMISVDGQAKRTLIEVRNALLVLVIAGTALAAALVAAVGATLQKPLGALTRSARQIGSGNLDLRVDIRSRDEIGQLIEAFNVMASRLREFRQIDHDRLSRTQQTTQLAIDSLPDTVFVMSPDGQIEISNQSARLATSASVLVPSRQPAASPGSPESTMRSSKAESRTRPPATTPPSGCSPTARSGSCSPMPSRCNRLRWPHRRRDRHPCGRHPITARRRAEERPGLDGVPRAAHAAHRYPHGGAPSS